MTYPVGTATESRPSSDTAGTARTEHAAKTASESTHERIRLIVTLPMTDVVIHRQNKG